jgi:hypothetical protein
VVYSNLRNTQLSGRCRRVFRLIHLGGGEEGGLAPVVAEPRA